MEAEAVNTQKSTAGAAALVALAELYRGIAALDVVDTTQLSAGGRLPPAARERAKLEEASTHFASTSDALARAIDVCAGFRRPATKEARPSMADCDASGFERLQAAVDRLRGARGDTLPTVEDLETVIAAAVAVATAWKDSAVGLRGTAGHYPAPASTRP